MNYTYEYDVLRYITHPHIVNVIGASEDNNHFYMEMEYCISDDLSKHLFPDANCNYLEKVIKTVSTELLLGLKELHSNGIIHCNLKPSNVLIDEHGNVKICDFKKALVVNKMTTTDIRRNKRGLSPCYTAPEIFTDEGTFSFKSDLWALGCIMFEMATGEVPFKDEILHVLIKKILNNEPDYNNKKFKAYSVEFQNVVKCLLQKDTSKRMSWGDIENMPFWDFVNDAHSSNSSNLIYDNSNTHKHEVYSSKTYSHNTSQIKSNVSMKNTYNNSLSTTVTNVHNNNHNNITALDEHNDDDNDNDDYSTGSSNTRVKDVNNTDQEFNLHYNTYNTPNTNHNPNKNNNFLELSILNINKVFTSDKRVIQTPLNDMAISVTKHTDIPNIESIMLHTSDRIIKPIIGNKLIESFSPIATYNTNMIAFPIYNINTIINLIATEQIELFDVFLLTIYKQMEQYITQQQYDYLLNILNYFESIILNKEVANNIINTSFVKLFISLMDVDNVDICIRACSIIANLIRYVTSMQHSLDEYNLTSKLIAFIKAENVNVMLNRKAIATLGEYFFFVATQVEGDNASLHHQWNIMSTESINALLYALTHNDEVVRFYALKTIENTVILTNVAKAYFASNDEFINRISEIYLNDHNNNIEIKTSALNTVAHIVKLEPMLMKVFINKFTNETLGNVLNNESSKNQQCIINIMLFGIVGNVNNINIINFDDVMPSMINLLESANSVIRGKIILLLSLVFGDKHLIHKYGEKVFNIMVKLRKDRQYYYYHVKIFESFMINFCKHILTCIIPQITKSISTNTANTNNDIISLITSLAVVAPYYKISFSLFTIEFIETLVSLISTTTNGVIQVHALDILRCFSETAYSVKDCSTTLTTSSLFESILNLTNIVADEHKRIPLNICANILTILLDDDTLYSSTSFEHGKTNQINSLILRTLPLMITLLHNEDTINDSLSFLALVIERNCTFITVYRSIGIIERVFALMMVVSDDNNYISNINLLKILMKLIEATDTTFDTIIELGLIDKVNYLISQDNVDDVSMYTEYVIEMLFELMCKLNEYIKKKDMSDNEECRVVFLKKIEGVVKNFKLCVKLFSCSNKNVQEKCAVIVILMLQFISSVNEYECCMWDVVFTSDNVVDLLKGLESPCVKIYKKIIKIFKWIIEYQYNAQDVLSTYKSYIKVYIEKIRDTSKDVDIVEVANRFLSNDLNKIVVVHNNNNNNN